ncbi:TIGR03503 family protein [Vibrio sp. 10N.286.49.B3]|uniref:TIGR03503 family protein n=1 Tax=Vibrio sp. 10N.286.49.B3 TaxID=1880855 RepID=UPI000C85A1EB|nr:TIGR03503 family protein [Vibrio sp. 10N.286.49.B3]PMH41076.1 TIGR03503 family protein [Vibrio sp. 10N.286.49.B3]
MLRIIVVCLLFLSSFSLYATTESSVSLLDNRFRVDPTIKSISFLIHREEGSPSVVLVRPDGKKYYAYKKEDNVRWYRESSIDIISIDQPMPGPWQAIGKVTPRNKVTLISHLNLSIDSLPNRLYQHEVLKFTAKLTSDGKPLQLKEFLDRVKLQVTLTEFIENEDELDDSEKPIPQVLGEFLDNGKLLDEYSGDGVFTVGLPIDVEPGKYRMKVVSGNGVFMRAKEQEVLVYPPPITTTFIQSRDSSVDHQVVIAGELGMIAPGSLAAHIEHKGPGEYIRYVQGQALTDDLQVSLPLKYNQDTGRYFLFGKAYASDSSTQRELIFPVTERSYSVVNNIKLMESKKALALTEAKQRQLLERQRLIEQREHLRLRNIIIIAVGNVVIVLLAFVAWFAWRKYRAKAVTKPNGKLEVPLG